MHNLLMKSSGLIFLERGFYKHTTCMSHTATKVFLYAALPQSFKPDLGNTHGQKNKIKKNI